MSGEFLVWCGISGPVCGLTTGPLCFTHRANQRIVITERSDDIHAAATVRPGAWACGKTRAQAVGDLIISHPELFSIELIEKK